MDLEVESSHGPSGPTFETTEGAATPPKTDQNPPFFDANLGDSRPRSKSSLRIRYEAETEIIRRKIGTLESIRQQLGLSQRKICQLLLVDPSAWSRWVRNDEDAPPHIYRMLQWYLALEEKYPALDVGFWLSNISRDGASGIEERMTASLAKVHNEQAQIRMELERFREQVARIAPARPSLFAVKLLFAASVFFILAFMLGRWTTGI